MKNKIFIGLIAFLLSYCINAGQHALVTYKYFFNGNEMPDMPKLHLKYSNNIALIEPFSNILVNKNYNEIQWLDYNERKAYSSAEFKNFSRVTTISSFDEYPKPELTSEYETILGFKCRKAKVVIRSNNIEIWFIENSILKGTPFINQGTELGLVLKIVRNGNFVIEAESIDTTVNIGINLPGDLDDIVDLPTYRDRITQSNYTTVQVFANERINYDNSLPLEDFNNENVTLRTSKGSVILKKVKLPENVWEHTIIAELSSYSDGDAYDRTGSLFVIPANKENTFLDALSKGLDAVPVYTSKNSKKYRGVVYDGNYSPAAELMRFITPFGIKKFNEQVTVKGIKWEDSVTYKQDITGLATALQGEVWIGVFIGNYDKGGHMVSVKLKYFPDDVNAADVKQKKFWIQPVINTVNIMEASGQEYGTMFDSDTLTVSVDIPAGLKSLKLRYISTGHGGWDGGDEFNQKLNEIFVDGKKYYSYIPWRTDCGMFRHFNPASGNFPNGMSSSDFSRSGWCPGSISIPVDIPLTGLSPGKHTIGVYIPIGKPEGTSVSSWNVSAVLVGEY